MATEEELKTNEENEEKAEEMAKEEGEDKE